MLRRLLAVGLVLPFLLAPACLSPTLPLPPPDAPVIEPGADADHVRLVAGCNLAEDNAIIVIVNENPAVPGDLAVSGSRTTACGAWDAVVYAHKSDVLDITQEVGDVGSTPVTVQVQ